ncbi:MAG: hypothetical protein A3D33_18875 [Candidatus Rokubacteria bacterium RIFCSPHIGHO2_02_FULL_73_26]|nr:MAG: hypothetical protein A3D33_18875 [Candidatus Rokubacteria bacterium RIFCSPHIGHO2_02_FULL_73_26]
MPSGSERLSPVARVSARRRMTEASGGKSSFRNFPTARRAERSVSTSAAEFQNTTRSSVSTAMTASGRPARTAS